MQFNRQNFKIRSHVNFFLVRIIILDYNKIQSQTFFYFIFTTKHHVWCDLGYEFNSYQPKKVLQNIYSKLSITCVRSGKWVNRNLTFESVIDNRKASVSILFLREAHTDQTKQSYTSSIGYTFSRVRHYICFISISYYQ